MSAFKPSTECIGPAFVLHPYRSTACGVTVLTSFLPLPSLSELDPPWQLAPRRLAELLMIRLHTPTPTSSTVLRLAIFAPPVLRLLEATAIVSHR